MRRSGPMAAADRVCSYAAAAEERTPSVGVGRGRQSSQFKGRFAVGGSAKQTIQAQQGFASARRATPAQALADDFAVRAQNCLLQTYQIGVVPHLRTHAGGPPSAIERIAAL